MTVGFTLFIVVAIFNLLFSVLWSIRARYLVPIYMLIGVYSIQVFFILGNRNNMGIFFASAVGAGVLAVSALMYLYAVRTAP